MPLPFEVSAVELGKLAPEATGSLTLALATLMPTILPTYGITTPRRLRHFLAQIAWESDYFTTLEESGGAAYFEKHYGCQTAVGKRLGNTQPGDGAKYHGRGWMQETGKDNYIYMGHQLGLDLANHPELAAEPPTALKIACLYWQGKGLNQLADRDDIREITRRINGGYNGLKQRTALYEEAKIVWPLTAYEEHPPVATPMLADATYLTPPQNVMPDAAIATEPAPKFYQQDGFWMAAGTVGSSVPAGGLALLQSPWAAAVIAVALVCGTILVWQHMRKASNG